MLFTPIAVILAGVWLIIFSRTTPSTGLTLVFGILVVVLAALDLIRPIVVRRTTTTATH